MVVAAAFNGRIELDIRDSQPDWAPFARRPHRRCAQCAVSGVGRHRHRDVGLFRPDSSRCRTWSRIAERGRAAVASSTPQRCALTRAALLTGRNATTVGMATIEEFTDGFPNCSGRIPYETGADPEVLAERGWNTYCVGKWHLTPLEESNLAATKRHWPLGRGFERFYGFMGGETDQWYP